MHKKRQLKLIIASSYILNCRVNPYIISPIISSLFTYVNYSLRFYIYYGALGIKLASGPRKRSFTALPPTQWTHTTADSSCRECRYNRKNQMKSVQYSNIDNSYSGCFIMLYCYLLAVMASHSSAASSTSDEETGQHHHSLSTDLNEYRHLESALTALCLSIFLGSLIFYSYVLWLIAQQSVESPQLVNTNK